MCGHFRMYSDEQDDALSERIQRWLQTHGGQDVSPDGDCTPGHRLPVYTPKGLTLVRWGLPLPDKRGLLVHLRAETALDKPFFRRALRGSGRCLFPAAAYYEWMEQDGHRLRCRFRSPLNRHFYMAGVQLPPSSPSGDPRAVLLTTAANGSVEPFHLRMPLILPKDLCRAYLFDPSSLPSLLKTVPLPLQPAFL